MKYTVVSHENKEAFEQIVNDHLERGWRLQGVGVSSAERRRSSGGVGRRLGDNGTMVAGPGQRGLADDVAINRLISETSRAWIIALKAR
jgi:hypothetical protein